jgi:hypothetical protein
VVAVVVEVVVELHKHFAVLLPQNLAVAVAEAEAVKEPHC